MSTSVNREGSKVWLDGALERYKAWENDPPPELFTPWAQRSDSFHYLFRMRIAGYDVDYATLNTVSGHGPSFSYCGAHEGNDYINYLPPAGRDGRIARATGCKLVWRQHKDIEKYWQALKQAVDAGQAVQAPNEEDIMFFGYVDADAPADRKVLPAPTLFVDDEEWTWAQFEKWFKKPMVHGWMGTIEGKVGPAAPRESAIEVMQMMVAFARGDDPRAKPNDHIHWGIEGIEAYAKDLADMTKSGGDTRKGHFGGGWRGCHCVYPQAGGRPAAAKYLRSIAPHFDSEAKKHIIAATEAYDDATAAWKKYFEQLGRDSERTVEVEHTVAWTTEQYRKAGAQAIADAARHERRAIAELEQALAAIAELGFVRGN